MIVSTSREVPAMSKRHNVISMPPSYHIAEEQELQEEFDIPEGASLAEIMLAVHGLASRRERWKVERPAVKNTLDDVICHLRRIDASFSKASSKRSLCYHARKVGGPAVPLVEALLGILELAQQCGIDMESLARKIQRHRIANPRPLREENASGQ